MEKILRKEFQHTSPMQTTNLMKIILNSGVSKAVENKKLLEDTVKVLWQIANQKPTSSIARKSITNFKLREGMPIGCKVTLRKKKA